jgi:3-oxoadipate enol-lactonase
MNKITVNGISLAYERTGQGAPLVLVHGFPLDHTSWNRLIPLLEKQFDLILPDLRGFGESSAPEAGYSLGDMAADLNVLLDGLELPAAFVAGHSMGGYVAMAFARRFGSKLLGLGILGSQAAADTPEKKLGRYENAEQVIKQGVAIQLGMAEKLSANPENVPFFREIILRQNPIGLANALKAMAERPDSLSTLSALTVPVVIVHGLKDVLVPVDRAREIKAVLPSARLFELPNVGHSPFLEAPVETAEALKSLM